jgi:hypothetical protein
MPTEGEIFKKYLTDQVRQWSKECSIPYTPFKYQTKLTDFSGFTYATPSEDPKIQALMEDARTSIKELEAMQNAKIVRIR